MTAAFVVAASTRGSTSGAEGSPGPQARRHDVAIDGARRPPRAGGLEGGPWRRGRFRAVAWGLGLAAGRGLLLVPIDHSLGRPAAALAVTAVGLGVLVGGLGAWPVPRGFRVSSGPRAAPPP